METDRLDALIHRADLDELVRHVERTVAARDWGHLVATRDAARAAVATGRQLWPIATLANYRLALRAPAAMAALALDDSARTFMPGPVSEILAGAHSWRDLEAHLPHGHDRSLVAYERALRGDPDADVGETGALEIPLVPVRWEPAYIVATYDEDGVHAPSPRPPAAAANTDLHGDRPTGRPAQASTSVGGAAIADGATTDAITDAFRQLVDAWTASSNGRADVAVVDGPGRSAVAELGVTAARLTPLDTAEAMSWLAWAGASGGAHGRRRGAATGRFGAWWLLAVIAGLDAEWPPSASELGEVLDQMSYWWWDTGEPVTGWQLRLVIEDHDEGISCALLAVDET